MSNAHDNKQSAIEEVRRTADEAAQDAERLAEADNRHREAVLHARALGVTWNVIARAVGLRGGGSAWSRYVHRPQQRAAMRQEVTTR